MSRPTTLHRTLALCLSGLILLSSLGFAVDLHYCQGQIKSFSFWGKAKNCYQLAKTKTVSCPVHGTMEVPLSEEEALASKKSCCHNETQFIQADHDLAWQYTELPTALPPYALFAFVQAFFYPAEFHPSPPDYPPYKPPLITQDIPILQQSFLL